MHPWVAEHGPEALRRAATASSINIPPKASAGLKPFDCSNRGWARSPGREETGENGRDLFDIFIADAIFCVDRQARFWLDRRRMTENHAVDAAFPVTYTQRQEKQRQRVRMRLKATPSRDLFPVG